MMRLTKRQFKEDFLKKLVSLRGENIKQASNYDKYVAFGSLIMDYIAQDWITTNEDYVKNQKKQVYYFSMEFLMGKKLISNLLYLGIKDICKNGLKELGISLDEIEEVEKDPGLGNGGLGRLAACFLDSMASLGIPGHGCGIRFKYGLFEQKIIDGYQVEFPDKWLQCENVWGIKKPSKAVEVKFRGNVREIEEEGRLKFIHENYESILAVPHDTPIIGYKNNKVNTLRLWSAEGIKNEFDFEDFNKGDYSKAFQDKYTVEAITHVLYPNDSYEQGRLLRLKQEYFFVSAGIQSIIRSFKKLGKHMKRLSEFVAIHINDTHPALAIPELMRILIDEENLGWDEAWEITTNTMAYTNHTIMAEALEKWDVKLFKDILPRIYMIVEEINERFCKELWEIKYEGDFETISKMAIIGDGQVRMAHLAIAGSHSVNGVAKLHTELLKNQELKNFYNAYPDKFNNKTNGITHRIWLLKSNKKLADLIHQTIGSKWIYEPENLVNLLEYKEDASFKERIGQIKQYNKNKLANKIKKEYGIKVDPNSIFDVHAKRIHEYKRQTLNIFHIMHLYNQLKENPNMDIHPRTFIFSGKAAPGYYIAKQIIKLINTVADKVNNDKEIQDKIKVIFMENYGVSLAEKIIPAANVSEQISTTTKEASGTGNMKFMMNGGITLATLDGANIEIKDAVGEDNIIIFGLKENEVLELYKNRDYKAIDIYNEDSRIKKVLDQLVNGFFPVKREEFLGIYDSLLKYNDEYFVLKDFNGYVKAQEKIDLLYKDTSKWTEMSIENIAHSGRFSSDKTINEYGEEIWNV